VTKTYHLVRNSVVISSTALGGVVYAASSGFAFTTAAAVGLVKVTYFTLFGREFAAYATG
jgi:hypothetical protein